MKCFRLLSIRSVLPLWTLVLLTIATLALPVSASITVRDWQFNTPGDNEGWTGSAFQISNLHVRQAVSGSETVLTCDYLQNQADPKIYSPDETISLPAGAVSWESLILRIRQLGTDGVTPVVFDSSGTIGLYGGGAIPTIAPIPTGSDTAATPPVTVIAQSDQWLLVIWDLSAYTGDINPKCRLDPMAGTLSGGEILGNFEIDYITLTAATPTTVSADAGADQVISDEDDDGFVSVTLDGSGSVNSSGVITGYEWAESLVPIATGVSPTVTLSVGSHLIELTATGDNGDTDTDTVAIQVNPYVPPMTYYLDAVNGDDVSGEGTVSLPWQTLDKVQSVVVGGDTVIMASGNYGSFAAYADQPGGWDIYDDWVIYKAADGADVEIESVYIAYTGVAPDDSENRGFYDAYLRFEDIHILDGFAAHSSRHWALINCLIERYGPWTGTPDNIEKTAVYFRRGTDFLIDGCEITNTGTGISGDGHDIRLLNSHIHDGTHDGVRVTGWWNSLVEGNRISGFDDGTADSEGLDWNRHCDLIHIFIAGGGQQNRNVVFRNNVIYDSESQGVQFNNYYGTPDLHNEQILFENNIFGPTRANVFNAGDALDGLIFRHNTFVVFDQPRTLGQWTLENYTLRISRVATGVQVYNNILGRGVPEAEAEVEIFEYNLYQLPLNVEPSGVDGSRGFGHYALVGVDPLFVNPGAFDGALDPASPAINFGTRDFAPTPICEQDINGTPRDARPDLGAWEMPGQTPAPEPHATVYDDSKTIFVDDFEDGHYRDIDPWLSAPNTQGLSWHRPDDVDFKFVVERSGHLYGNALIDPQGDSVLPRTAYLFSDQGDSWIDYDFSFEAFNTYAVIGSGVMVLAHDRDNHYWLDISRDNGRLIRTLGGVQTELARDADIELPHVGLQVYSISVRHGQAGEITISVDTHDDGSVDFSYTDTDATAVAAFGAGGVGFHSDVVNIHNRVHYDNIEVTILAGAGDLDFPGDANGDGSVNLDDFIILKQNYGIASGANFAQGDFNGDGAVNLDDFIILKQNYGTTAN